MKRILCCFVFVLLPIITVFAAYNSLFTEPMDFTKVSSGVLHSKIFRGAQNSQASVFSYLSIEMPSCESYSRYQITVINHLRQLSYYQTIEMPVDNDVPEVRGEGIGFGGIVSLAYQKGQTKDVNPPRPGWPTFTKEFKIMKITNVSGKLFPLKVGNELIFNYMAMVQTKQGSYQENGEYVYDVVGKRMGYQGAGIAVPGPIYVIKLSRKLDSNPLLMPMNEYLFSTYLNWYVEAKYFYQGKVGAIYKLAGWT